MPQLDEIRPRSKARIIDLVAKAGIDVSDWSDGKLGAEGAAANPKYCYQWAFIQPGKFVILNLWLRDMTPTPDGETIQATINYRKTAVAPPGAPRRNAQIRRAKAVEEAIQAARGQRLPARIIVLEGRMRDRDNLDAESSKVSKRTLDEMPWAVTHYDEVTGDCVLARGASPQRFADQFGLVELNEPVAAERHLTTRNAFRRDARVRYRVMARSLGLCELCGQPGFEMSNGEIYLETHHIVPMSEGGPDAEANVVALCPNDHRQAHHAKARDDIRQKLQALRR